METSDGTGSGFVIDQNGYILTNEHVVEDHTSANVLLDRGIRVHAMVVATDATRDIALLKVDSAHVSKALEFANSLLQGEPVIALGHPLGRTLGSDMTITTGVVSAFRTFEGVQYVQTDAALNPGNSGGPLLNEKGEVVGMNTGGIDETDEGRSVEGISFAISYDVLKRRLPIMKASTSTAAVTSTPIPTPIATPRPTSTPAPTVRQVGPVSGSILHDPDDGFIDIYDRNWWFADGSIQASFINPERGPQGWSYGFMFRRTGTNHFHAVVITDDRAWAHVVRLGDVDTASRVQDYSTAINTGVGEENHIRVDIQGSTGSLHINNQQIARLNLSGLTEMGEASVIGSYYTGHASGHGSTYFEDLIIIPHGATSRPTPSPEPTPSPTPTPTPTVGQIGPIDGSIPHNRIDDLLDIYDPDVWMKNGSIEAHFINPEPGIQGWSYGFLFRNSQRNHFHAVLITDDRNWVHLLRQGGRDDQIKAYINSPRINTEIGEGNHILVEFSGARGRLNINYELTAYLDLGGITETGRASVVASYWSGHATAKGSTQFLGLIVNANE